MMTCRTGPTGSALCRAWLYLAVASLGLGLSCPGCGESEPPAGQGDDAASRTDSDETKPVDPKPGDFTPGNTPAKKPGELTALEVMQKMADAYKAAESYADAGRLKMKAATARESIDEDHSFALTMVRPNKIRMEIEKVMVVSDGETLRAAIPDELPGQVTERPVPDDLTPDWLFTDGILIEAISARMGPSQPLALLMEDDPLPLLAEPLDALRLAEPGLLEGREYYRVESPVGTDAFTFWIDKQTFALRRVVYPTDQLREQLTAGGAGPIESIVMVADFEGARLGGDVDPIAFAFDVPADAVRGKYFVPPNPAQLLGRKTPDFEFFDLRGNPVTPASLAGKVVVLKFWATWCQPCRQSFPVAEKVRQQLADDERIVFLAVSVDEPNVVNEELEATLADWGTEMTILRDTHRHMSALFHNRSLPGMVVIDAMGTVQYFEQGFLPTDDPAGELAAKIEDVVAGRDLYPDLLEQYQKDVQQFERRIEAAADPTQGESGGVTELAIPQATIAPASEPKTFTLTRLWENTKLTSPGNILVIDDANGSPRLLVADAGSAVAEVGLDGTLIANHPLKLGVDPTTQRPELVTNLRTAVGADGRRYVAAMASSQQRFHLLDADFNHVLSYPPDALENRHSGIADVQLADLDGDGVVEAAVSYWGPVGVQGVSLAGKRLWANRSVANVERMTVIGPGAEGRCHLLCTNANDTLVALDHEGNPLGEIPRPGRPTHCVVAADLDADGQVELCTLAAASLGENVAFGLDFKGNELWSHRLPLGVYQRPIEPIVVGRLAPGETDQWILPAPDGSIHVIAANGQPIDQFSLGMSLSGLATVEHDGKRLLIIANGEKLEAYRVGAAF